MNSDNETAVARLLAHAMVTPGAATVLARSPEEASRQSGQDLSPDELQSVMKLNLPQIEQVAVELSRLLSDGKRPRRRSRRGLAEFISIVQQQEGVSEMLEDLMAVLDQQQQKGDGGVARNLAALLDQQQQQKGRQFLQGLSAILDQQQQQGGARGLQDLVALLDQQQQQKGRKFLTDLAAVLDQQQQQGRGQIGGALGAKP